MRGVYFHSPNKPSWCGAKLKSTGTMQRGPPKRWLPTTSLHGVITHFRLAHHNKVTKGSDQRRRRW